MVAVAKSFLGHYLGAAEGFEGLILKGNKSLEKDDAEAAKAKLEEACASVELK